MRGKSSEKVSEQAISRLHNSDADETAGIVPGWLRIIRNEPLRFLRPFDTCVLPLAVLSHQQTRNNPVHKPITETSANEEARGKKRKETQFRPTGKPISVVSLRKEYMCQLTEFLPIESGGFKNTSEAV